MRGAATVAALAAAVLTAGCDFGGGEEMQEAARRTIAADEARAAKARQAVEAKLPQGTQATFSDVHSYHNRGTYVVCGTVAAEAGQPAAQKFIFREGGTATLESEAADFARQAEDLCRTYSESDSGPDSSDMDMMTDA